MEIKENTILVILGASGDLAKKKLVCLLPLKYRVHVDSWLTARIVSRAIWSSIYAYYRCITNLVLILLISPQEKRCVYPDDFKVIGFAPDEMSHEAFIDIIRKPIKLESPRFAEQLKQFCNRCSYVSGHEGGDKAFEALHQRLEALGQGKKDRNHLFYMALPPKIFVSMSQMLKKHCYSARGGTRIIVGISSEARSRKQS